jgi:hypothetical protein
MKRKVRKFVKHIRKRQRWAVATGIVLLVLMSGYVTYRFTLYHRAIGFGYGRPTCFVDFTLLPGIFKGTTSGAYVAKSTDHVRLKGYPLFSGKTCIEAQRLPREGHKEWVSVAMFGNPMLKKRFWITAAPYPKLRADVLLQPTLSTRDPIKMRLDQADEVFDYYLKVADKQQRCQASGQELFCDVMPLGLTQGTPYKVAVQRYFGKDKVADIVQQQIITTSPVNIVGGSVQPGGVIYDVPKTLHLTASRPLNNADVVLETINAKGERQMVEQKTTIADKDIAITLAQPLARNTAFELTVRSAEASDKGFLEKPYVVPFTVSGGPKVVGVNIGRTSVDPGAAIVITFDQALDPGQDFSKLVVFKSDTGGVFAASVQGARLTIRPAARLPICSTFSIQLSNDIKSTYGITGNSAWSYNSRVICYTISTIGYSVRGRAIQAWRFGNGPSKILYVATTHGDERSTKYLMDRWVAELEAHPDRIPAHRTIIVIPTLNPDGFVVGSRRNANDVDLNRNFPANNWKPDVTMPGGGAPVKNGGGTQPLSEPESRALANFVTTESPRLVLTYHSVASIVSANGAGDSAGLAAHYSRLSGYRDLPGNETDSVFQYDTTGAFEDWLYDRVGVATLLIELGSHTNAEFGRNSAAMWAMAQLP